MALYHTVKGPVDYTVVGNPTIQNGIVSNFSTSGYLTIPAPNLSMANDWEIVTKANIPSLSSYFQVLLTGSPYHQFAGLDIDGSGRLGAAIGNSSGDGWQIIENSTDWVGVRKTIPLNTDFWAKLTFNGLKYSIYYSEDGENWEETVYFNSTQKIYHDPTNVISIGIGRLFDSLTCSGSIDLNETYIKVNGQPWFGNCPVEVKKVVRQGVSSEEVSSVDSLSLPNAEANSLTEVNYIVKDGKLIWADPNIYLEGTGTQYIDTGITASNDTYECKFSDFVFDPISAIFGSAGSYNYSLAIFLTDIRYCFPDKMYVGPSFRVNDLYTDLVICSDGGVNSANYTYSLASDTNSGSGNMCLFTGTPTMTQRAQGKINYFKWTKTNGIFMHLVPVPAGLVIGSYTVPSNGMFDIVHQQFYGNQGTGDFNIGRDE